METYKQLPDDKIEKTVVTIINKKEIEETMQSFQRNVITLQSQINSLNNEIARLQDLLKVK